MDGGAWWATVHRFVKNRTRLSDFTSLEMTEFKSKRTVLFQINDDNGVELQRMLH